MPKSQAEEPTTPAPVDEDDLPPAEHTSAGGQGPATEPTAALSPDAMKEGAPGTLVWSSDVPLAKGERGDPEATRSHPSVSTDEKPGARQ